MLQEDFSQIVLSEREMHLFQKFKYADRLVLTRDEWAVLSQTDLIKHHLEGHSDWFDNLPESGICELSEKGVRYREYLNQQSSLLRKGTRRFWIPIIISNLISLAAVVISLISLTRE